MLSQNESVADSSASESMENEIGNPQKSQRRQIKNLIQKGLKRTHKEASIKQGIDKGLQVVQAVRGMVDKALHPAPGAAIAWVSVCLGLEVCPYEFFNGREALGSPYLIGDRS